MSSQDEPTPSLGSVEHILTIEELRALMKLAAWTTPAQRADSGLTREESDIITTWLSNTAKHYYGPNWSAIFMALDRNEPTSPVIEMPMARRCQEQGGV